MTRRLLPMLLVASLLLVGTGAATVLLNESRGSTWIAWDWNVTALEENQVLVGRYDGAEVLNLSAAAPQPLPTLYRASDLNPSEPHDFSLVLLNTSTDPPTVEETASSSATTGQAESNFFVYLGAGVLLCLVGFFFGRANRIVALFLFVIAFLTGGYTAAATAGSNMVLFGFGVIVALLSLAGMVFAFLELTQDRRGWGE